MSAKDFAHLHLHTQYSFLDGAIRVKDLISKTHELGMSKVAVTDHGNMFGAADFYQQATKAGITPIIGIEAYVTGKAKYTEKIRENFHLVLLAENNIGYQNLCKLSSESFINGKYYHPRVDKHLLKKHSEGLIALTACLGGEVGKKCTKNDMDGARQAIRDYKDIFGPDNFFLEVQPNGLKIQDKVNADLAQFAKDENLKLAATNDCHYVTKDQHDAQNILMAIRQQKAWNDPTLHKHETDSFYIRSGQEMFDLLRNDYGDAFNNTCEIAKRCNISLDLGNTYLPNFAYPDKEFKDEADYLYHLSIKGLEQRFAEIAKNIDQEQYRNRLNEELKIIVSMGFSGYFLIVQDFINWAKNNQIRVGPGRGSGAGSIVAYALRITDVDPIPYNLLFERFLNPQRVSMPDFDVDFMQEKRGEVINYVAQKYGRDHVGQIATYSGLNPKSAIKDVARTLEVPFAEINELTKPIPTLVDGKKPTFEESLTFADKLKSKASQDNTYKRILKNARVLEGLYRQAGMHAGGIVIGKKPLVQYAPLFLGQNNELITQFDKDKIEDVGLVKFDFLGLKTLDTIKRTEDLINSRIERENKLDVAIRKKMLRKHFHAHKNNQEDLTIDTIAKFNIDIIPLDIKKVYKLISSGDTLGIFQVESSGFQDLCRKLQPDCFEDIIAAVALYRPGPMQSGMVDDFIDRKHGRKKVVYPHKLLAEILRPTYGTFVYQEQVMQSAQALSGYTLGDADILRRAMGKKKFDEMKKQREIFVQGAENNKVEAQQAGEIFDTIEKFAGYGFNKSHSAAYALITYQTAYLKCFYPVEFMAALLTTESGNSDNIVKYINEAKSHNIAVLPPDVNISDRKFTVDYNENYQDIDDGNYAKIRFGLEAIKGLGDAAVEAILAAVNKHNRFDSLFDFCNKIPVQKINKRVLETLIKSGAMDGFNKKRALLYNNIEKALNQSQALQKDQKRGQSNMFDLFSNSNQNSDFAGEKYKDGLVWPLKEELKYERESLGFYLSGHPLDKFQKTVKQLGAISTTELVNVRHLQEISIAGIASDIKERPLKRGDGRWAVITVEDNFGQAEILAFNKSYQDNESIIKSGEPILFQGRALIDEAIDENQQSSAKIRLKDTMLLSDAQMLRISHVDITMDGDNKQKAVQALHKIKEICQNHPGQKPILLKIIVSNQYEVNISCGSDYKLYPDDHVIALLNDIDGLSNITVV